MLEKVKIRFNLQSDPVSGESIWAEKLNQHLYRLLNVPYEAVGYAEGDIVCTVERDGWEEILGIEQDSGNGTIRIFFATQSKEPKAQHILDELVSAGCTYERASSKLVAVTIPANVEIPMSQIANYLNGIGKDVIVGWEISKNPI